MRSLFRRVAILAAGLGIAMAVTILPGSPASADIISNVGKKCVDRGGGKLTVCSWVNFDTTTNVVRAYGQAFDTTSGNVSVAIQVFLEFKPAGQNWQMKVDSNTSPRVVDYESVATHTGLYNCYNNNLYRARVNFNWNNGAFRDFSVSYDASPNGGCR